VPQSRKVKKLPISRLLTKAELIHIRPKANTNLLLIPKSKYPCAHKPISIPLSPHFQNPIIPMLRSARIRIPLPRSRHPAAVCQTQNHQLRERFPLIPAQSTKASRTWSPRSIQSEAPSPLSPNPYTVHQSKPNMIPPQYTIRGPIPTNPSSRRGPPKQAEHDPPAIHNPRPHPHFPLIRPRSAAAKDPQLR
jgi:hypothetical protein